LKKIFIVSLLLSLGCSDDKQQPITPSCTNNEVKLSTFTIINGGILNIEQFLSACPLTDPLINQILSDFEFRIDGTLVTKENLSCDAMLSSDASGDVLKMIQTLRTMYYIDLGSKNYLPWSSENLYNWMKLQVNGINIFSESGSSNCCSTINGKQFIYIAARTESTRVFDNSHLSEGVLNSLLLFAHERRHADASGYPHCNCALGDGACDPYYNSSDLGAYGVQFFLSTLLYNNKINIGLSQVNPTRSSEIKNFINPSGWLNRFCQCPPKLN
jgi:hypothetical protein